MFTKPREFGDRKCAVTCRKFAWLGRTLHHIIARAAATFSLPDIHAPWWHAPQITMDRSSYPYDIRLPAGSTSPSAGLAYGILALYLVHQLLLYYDYPVLSPQELVWNALVYAVPARFLLDAEKRQQLREADITSQMQAAKSESLRRMLGWGSGALSHKLVGGEGLMRSMSLSRSSDEPTTDAPPGLGNWDNSCYQNSVLQGLASLDSLKKYLRRNDMVGEDSESTGISLRETVAKLNDANNNGKQLWTPAKLKNMSSWQQQDAQEYFSKIMDELDKEAAKSALSQKAKPGLETVVEAEEAEPQQAVVPESEGDKPQSAENPLEGLLAQRVACTSCGFSEGLSMIPFNCLTVPLGSDFAYDVDDCLDEYTKLEEISDVDCPKCTLLRSEGQLSQMVSEEAAATRTEKPSMDLPPEVRVQVAKRLQAIQHALENDDFADKTLNGACQIPKKAHVSSTKTRQAVIGRAPHSLVVHVNRSVFDELTGVQRKNHASVRYPMVLDLGAWMLGEGSGGKATQSMLEPRQQDGASYRLKAVVTHYGRHENGHYICYRRHPLRPRSDADVDGIDEEEREQWWRLSDEDVSAVSEENVLGQGGVFMLFYEREEKENVQVPEAGNDVPAPTDTIQHENFASDGELVKPQDTVAAVLPSDEKIPEAPEAEQVPAAAAVSAVSHGTEEPERVTDTAQQPTSANRRDHVDEPSPPPVRKVPSPPLMRTSRGRQSGKQGSLGDTGSGNPFRAVTAS